jgi:hypothetical protein
MLPFVFVTLCDIDTICHKHEYSLYFIHKRNKRNEKMYCLFHEIKEDILIGCHVSLLE